MRQSKKELELELASNIRQKRIIIQVTNWALALFLAYVMIDFIFFSDTEDDDTQTIKTEQLENGKD